MLTTAIIAFREFLEAFLIVGVFLSISRKLELKKELEITLAAGLGIFLSLLLSVAGYLFADQARGILTEKNADFLESYLLIFSGLFIVYVVFSLHNVLRYQRGGTLIQAHHKLQQRVFDLSLFFTIVFLVLREGFEIALFTASASLFSAFMQNFLGLIMGFGLSAAIGIALFIACIRVPVGTLFKVTEYMIVLVGASLVQNGITKLFETHFHIFLSQMLALPMQFLPDEDTMIGHMLQSLFGIDRDFSGIRLLIMVAYIGTVYFFFYKKINLRFLRQEKKNS
jgi:high-affinity iron transporter